MGVVSQGTHVGPGSCVIEFLAREEQDRQTVRGENKRKVERSSRFFLASSSLFSGSLVGIVGDLITQHTEYEESCRNEIICIN